MIARDVMTRKPKTVPPDATITAAADIMQESEVGLLPVVDDPHTMHVVGVITDRDITVRCTAHGHDPRSCTVGDHMTRPPLVTVHGDTEIDAVIDAMTRGQVRRVLVVSGKDRLHGVLTLADLGAKLGHWAPAKVGRALEHVALPVVTDAR
ncbi:MAG TPA: CBS domain-containing protein [Gemmatimonadaceae bacterium]|nr:CBS domain-containing protein [Gemmatimonadaceae bacterium]